MSSSEAPSLRLFSPTEVFGGRFRHPCHAGCGQVMVVPDPTTNIPRLEEGHIWACGHCFAKHEYYLVLSQGMRAAGVRLLVGTHNRGQGEPGVGEFIEKETP